VEDDDRGVGGGGEALDGDAGGVFAGVASASGDDAGAGSGEHFDVEAVGGAVDGGVEEVENVGFEAEEDGLGFGVAEAGVELEDHGAARGHHETDEEDSAKGSAFLCHAVDDFLGYVVDDPAGELGGGEGVGGVGAHAAGVGAGVAFADALVVLGGCDGDGVGAVAEGEEGELFAGEELFEDDLGVGGAEEGAGEDLGGDGEGFGVGVADDDAFAGGEAGGFYDYGCGKAGELLADFVEGGAEGVGGGGDVVAAHEVLGEGFAGLEAGGGLGGAEDSVAAGGELVDDAEGEGDFGADDGEGRVLDGDDVDEGVEIVDVDGDAAGELGDASVAGSGDDFSDCGGFAERPDECVLAATAADD